MLNTRSCGMPPEVLPGQRISLDGIGQRAAGDMDAQPSADGEQAGVEGHVVHGAGGQAAAGVQGCCPSMA